jgi:hypothetical protein
MIRHKGHSGKGEFLPEKLGTSSLEWAKTIKEFNSTWKCEIPGPALPTLAAIGSRFQLLT